MREHDHGVRERAARRGILLGNWSECWSRPDPPTGVIIGFGQTDVVQLAEVLSTLGELLST